MSDNLSPEDAERFAHYEKLGEKQVRLLMSNGGLPPPSQPGVIRWLARKDQESARIKDASQAEQLEIGRSAKDAAWAAARAAERAASAAEAANRRAVIAIIIAATSAVIAIVIPLAFH